MAETSESQQQYGSILTVLGENAEQNGKLQNKQITFTHIAIGDANDQYIQPDRKQTTLINELDRIPVNSVDVLQATEDSVPILKVEAILPDDINDIVIREFAAVATFNGNSYLHAVGNCARIYVPNPANNGNVSTPVTLEMTFVITSADPIVEIDPNVITASREWTAQNFVKSNVLANDIKLKNYSLYSAIRASGFDEKGIGSIDLIRGLVEDDTSKAGASPEILNELIVYWDANGSAFAKDPKHIDDFIFLLTSKPDVKDKNTWDWYPAIHAAGNLKKNIELDRSELVSYDVSQSVVISNSNFNAKLFICNDGEAEITGKTLGDSGDGFRTDLEIDDPLQPAYVPIIDVINGSGRINHMLFESVKISGNHNTAGLRLKGCCGVVPWRMTFGTNRFGIVFSNDVRTGTFTEHCVATRCLFNTSCLVDAYYEKGAGDRSFHGSGIIQSWSAKAGNYPSLLLSKGALPYNAPLEMNILKSCKNDGTDKPIILTRGTTGDAGAIVTFKGFISTEGEVITLCDGDRSVALVGGVTGLGLHYYGKLLIGSSARANGPIGGNLNTVLDLFPQKKEYRVAEAGTVITIGSYSKRLEVQIIGSGLDVIFELSIQRSVDGGMVYNSPITVYRELGATVESLNLNITTKGLEITSPQDGVRIMTREEQAFIDSASSAGGKTANYLEVY